MQQKNMNYLPLMILPIILLMCIGLWTLKSLPLVSGFVDSDSGVFDMRDHDFSEQKVWISRTVEYVDGELLTPDEFTGRDDIQIGRAPDGARPYTMRIRVLVPDDHYYGIGGYSVNYASRVYINGKWIFDEGKPARTQDAEHSTEKYYLFSAEPVDGVIDILIATSSFSNVDSSSGMNWFFGEYEMLHQYFVSQIAIDIMVMAWYLIAALVAFLLFLALPAHRANGWLALFCIVWSIRTGLKGYKILLTLFPYFEWPVVYKTEILTSPITIILFALMLHSSFPGALPKWLRRSLIGAAGAFALAILILPWERFLGHSSYTNMIIYLALAIMLPFTLFSMRKSKFAMPQVIILAGVCMSIFAFAWDADYFAHGDFLFAFTQPTMLAFSLFLLASTLLATMQKTVAQEVLLAQTVERQQQELMDARVSVMLSQIQPHFLYNSLTAIADACEDSPKAQGAILDFSAYLRNNLESIKSQKLIPFERELAHIETYLKLEKLRFEDELCVVYDIREKDFLLPALTVQPLVENAVKHGVGKKRGGGTVTIATAQTEAGYVIAVSDDGVGFDVNEQQTGGGNHVGIKNIMQRLDSQCGGTFTVTSTRGVGTTATIIIPKGVKP